MKGRVNATVHDKLLEEIQNIHIAEVEAAKDSDRAVPCWSNTVEMLLRKGVRAYKSNAKTVQRK